MRRLKKLVLFGILLVSLSFAFAADVPTQVEIENTPPYVTANIPDILIFQGDNYTLDLDDYFAEDNGETWVVTYSPISNIGITINSGHEVIFAPVPGYTGEQYMNFTVADSAGNVTGNTFKITIGEDTEPPQWLNAKKDRINVYQNYHVTFSSIWTDNSNLASYTFSINQAGTWVNISTTNFTGTVNTSSKVIQISASPGARVYWRFYAADDKGNINVTDTFDFTVQEFEIDEGDYDGYYGGGGSGSGSGSGAANTYSGDSGDSISLSSFSVSPKNLKITLRQGDTITKMLRITNTGDKSLIFSAELRGIASLGVLSEKSFNIGPGETYELLLELLVPPEQMPDQYFGTVVIGADESLVVPVVLDVRPFNSQIEVKVNVSEKSRAVSAGEEVIATIQIKNLFDIREGPASIVYALKDFSGNILVSNQENITLFNLFEEERSLVVPEGTVAGEYIFYALAFSRDRIDLDSDTFFVGLQFKIMFFLKQFLYLLIFAILIFIILFLYYTYKRNRRKKQLLELYLLLNELRALVKKGKLTEAIVVYKRIKVAYGQKISKDFIKEDQEKLKAELLKFAKVLKENPIVEAPLKQPVAGTPKQPVTGSIPQKASLPKPSVVPTKPSVATPSIKKPEAKGTPTLKTLPQKTPSSPVQKKPVAPVPSPVEKKTPPTATPSAPKKEEPVNKLVQPKPVLPVQPEKSAPEKKAEEKPINKPEEKNDQA